MSAGQDPTAARATAARVRTATRDDLARLWEMVLALSDYERLRHRVTGTAEALGALLFAPGASLEALVLEEPGGALVGYALVYPVFSSFRADRASHLEDLYVEPSRRGLGYGRRLLEAVARRCLERGEKFLDWVVLDWNEPSIRFYRRLGAVPVGEDWLRYAFDESALRALLRDA